MKVTVEIRRFNPEKDSEPYYRQYEVEAEPTDRLLSVLMEIKRVQDPTLGLRKSCAHGVCGSDAMIVNGRERLACKTLIQDVFAEGDPPIRVEPLRTLPVQRDLMVDQAGFFDKYERAKPYFIAVSEPPEKERVQTSEERKRFDEGTSCILCASCYSACPVPREKNKDFLGPAALVQAARFIQDSRDEGFDERLPVLDDPDGVWSCENHFECTRVCPRGIKITKQINLMKRRIEKSREGQAGP